jgi:toxin-antitoxin system PIN domain toxin
VIVLDANILLYAYDAASNQHVKARAWLEEVLSGTDPVGLPWQTVTAFVRIVTNPRLSGKRFTPAEVIDVVDKWVDQPNVRLLGPGDHHWSFLRQTIMEGQARGPLITDAQLAALTIEHGGILCTTDRDFSRFPGLRWQNPIV